MFDDLPFWAYFWIVMALNQMSTISVTVYLHRHLTHDALELHPAVKHIFRFIIWLKTGTIPDQWRAIHLWHHQDEDTPNDPHSPLYKTIWGVLFGMYFLYERAKRKTRELAMFGTRTPQDWMERSVYRHTWLGLALMLPIFGLLFGLTAGAIIWATQILWMPFVAGIINGAGHYWGYRNYETSDNSRNIWILSPLGLLVSGEELHNNHHGRRASAKLSRRWFEFDLGWCVVRLLEVLGLAWDVRR